MFIIRIAGLAVVLVTLAQLPGCHYYIEGMPKIIVASEPIHVNQTGPN